MSVDPLKHQYPFYSPYHYAGNTPIWAVDIDGLEPAVLFGGKDQIESAKKINKNIQVPNWYPAKLVNLTEALLTLKKHKEIQKEIETVYITSHGGQGILQVIAGPDKQIATEACIGSLTAGSSGNVAYTCPPNDDGLLSEVEIEAYIEQNIYQREHSGVEIWEAIETIQNIGAEIKDGGTLIFGGCHASLDDWRLIKSLYELTGRRINIVLNQDYTNGLGQNNKVFDGYLTLNKKFLKGWVILGPKTNGEIINSRRNLKLNSKGKDTYTIEKPKSCTSSRDVCCFISGTKVLMSNNSSRNIEFVQLGDTVKTINITTMEIENKKVIRVASPLHTDLLEIEFSNGSTNVNTFDHSYFVKGKGWCSYRPELTKERYGIDAKELKATDVIYQWVEGTLTEVTVERIVESIGEKQTYTIYTEGNNHNYFANGVLVHDESILQP